MKKYKHKGTGKIAELMVDNNYYHVECGHHPVAAWIVESGNDWEEIEEPKEYEIQAYVDIDKPAHIYNRTPDGRFARELTKIPCDKDILLKNNCKIYSVKRLSDGSIWRIGDTIVHSNCRLEEAFIIDNFQLGVQNDIWANPKGEKGYCHFSYWEKVEPVQVPTDREKLVRDVADIVRFCNLSGIAYNDTANQILEVVEKRGDIPVEKKEEKVV